MKPILSIVTPTIISRAAQLVALNAAIEKDRGDLPVEHIWIGDNCMRSIGEKRNNLHTIARGEYIAFVDDDDEILPGYCAHIVDTARRHTPDVITFKQDSSHCGLKSTVIFKLDHQGDGPYVPDGITRRRPWHVCAWRRDVVRDCLFLHCNYGEDRIWVDQAFPLAKRGAHLDIILHRYIHSAETTAAPPPNA
jgi:glycosyltransferase involved in cell wall biosynthesis